MKMFSTTDRMSILSQEVEFLKKQLQPHDTGHIHTTINVIEHRIEQLHQQELEEQKQRNR